MVRAKQILVILLLLSLIPSVLSLWTDEAEEVIMDLEISNSFEITSSSSSSELKEVLVTLFFVPSDSFENQISNLVVSPESKINDGQVGFVWNRPSERQFDINIAAQINSVNKFKEIKTKVDFPLGELDPELIKYVQASDIIDSNDRATVKLAKSLSAGEDDLYVVVQKLAAWTKKNIVYTLDTLTAEVTQSSSWVLTNREGVCDELTALFLAMARSLGIPSRYVSGFAYTNWNKMDDWGSHAWAEVYFPGYGWVPYDVTYGQFGYIDPSHISLKKSVDADSTSINYEWRGRNVELDAGDLDIKIKLKESIGKIKPYISLSVDVLKDKVGFNSYNLIEVTMKNLNDYYIPVELSFAKVKEIEFIGGNKNVLLLRPNEEKKLFWLVKVIGPLSKGFVYTFPMEIYGVGDISASDSFQAAYDQPVYTKDTIAEFIDIDSTDSNTIRMNCESEKDFYYINDKVKISCFIENTGILAIENLNVCTENNCISVDIGASNSKVVDFLLSGTSSLPGKKELIVVAQNGAKKKISSVNLEVFEKPTVSVIDIEYPTQVSFKDSFKVQFTLDKDVASAYNVTVTLSTKGASKSWNLNELNTDKKFIVEILAQELNEGDNVYNVEVIYYDLVGESYTVNESFTISLAKLRPIEKIRSFFFKLELWLKSRFGK